MNRIKTGWGLTKDSWAVLKADRSLASFPAISFVATVVAFVLLIAPGVVVAAAAERDWIVLPFALVAAYAATFVAVYFNVALAGAATLSLDGKDTTLRDGMAVATQRRGVIARWAGVQLAIGILINLIENAFGNSPAGRLLGLLVGAVLGAAWGVATFFVIPVLAVEGLTPKAAFTRSVAITKERWGEGIVGNAAVGLAVFLFAGVPIVALFAGGSALSGSAPAVGGILIGSGVLVAVAAAVVGSALSIIFRVALYRYATTGRAAGGFDAGTLGAAFRER